MGLPHKTPPVDLYVSSARLGNRVDVYNAGASGNALPVRSIIGVTQILFGTSGLALDSAGNLYVGDVSGPPNVKVYDANANGYASPIRILNVGLVGAVAIDSADNLYVLSGYGAGADVQVFSPGAPGNATPIRTITGIYPGSGHLRGIAVDLLGNLYLSHTVPGTISIYPPEADGPGSPIRTFSTGLSVPSDMDFDGANNLYVADGSNIVVFDRFASDGDAPIRTINGVSNDLGIAVDQDGYIYATAFDVLADNTQVNPRIVVYGPRANGNAAPVRTITGLNYGDGLPYCLAISKVRKKPTFPSNPALARVLELVGAIYGGVAVDGGGVIVVNGWPIPVGPWGPIGPDTSARRDVLIGLAIEQLALHVSDVAGQNRIRGAALQVVNARINELLAGIAD